MLSKHTVYSIDTSGEIKLVKTLQADNKWGAAPEIWSAWQDHEKNIYLAIFNEKSIRKIDRAGITTTVYKSTGDWTPLHGVFDNDNRLWIMENSSANEVRVTLVEPGPLPGSGNKKDRLFHYFVGFGFIVGIGLLLFRYRKRM